MNHRTKFIYEYKCKEYLHSISVRLATVTHLIHAVSDARDKVRTHGFFSQTVPPRTVYRCMSHPDEVGWCGDDFRIIIFLFLVLLLITSSSF